MWRFDFSFFYPSSFPSSSFYPVESLRDTSETGEEGKSSLVKGSGAKIFYVPPLRFPALCIFSRYSELYFRRSSDSLLSVGHAEYPTDARFST